MCPSSWPGDKSCLIEHQAVLQKKRTAKVAAATAIKVWSQKNRFASVREKRCDANDRLFAGLAENDDANAGKGRLLLPGDGKQAAAWRRKNGLLHAVATTCRQKAPPMHARLWTSRCISTGCDVQNRPFCRLGVFSPPSVQARYNPCPARSLNRKLLILWSKPILSTVNCSFTITTKLYTYL